MCLNWTGKCVLVKLVKLKCWNWTVKLVSSGIGEYVRIELVNEFELNWYKCSYLQKYCVFKGFIFFWFWGLYIPIINHFRVCNVISRKIRSNIEPNCLALKGIFSHRR